MHNRNWWNGVCMWIQHSNVVRVNGVRLCLWTAAADGPFVHPQVIYMNMESHDAIILTGKTEELGEKPVQFPLCPPQIPLGLTRERTRPSAVRGRWLTAWAMARPCFVYQTLSPWGKRSRMSEKKLDGQLLYVTERNRRLEKLYD
jgi:hypothetical protein